MEMTKEQITLEDGRYLIYFKFKDKKSDEQKEKEAAARGCECKCCGGKE